MFGKFQSFKLVYVYILPRGIFSIHINWLSKFTNELVLTKMLKNKGLGNPGEYKYMLNILIPLQLCTSRYALSSKVHAVVQSTSTSTCCSCSK